MTGHLRLLSTEHFRMINRNFFQLIDFLQSRAVEGKGDPIAFLKAVFQGTYTLHITIKWASAMFYQSGFQFTFSGYG